MEGKGVIGKYRLNKLLGAGGMGVVYSGKHMQLGRQDAIKILRPEFSNNQEALRRFFGEAKAATEIKHPGIVQIYDSGVQDDGSAYIAMELLEGEGLNVRLRRLGSLPVLQALRFTGQIASALAVAHARGIFHRDLKPGNLFIVPDEQVPGGERLKILDFGIAKFANPDVQGVMRTRAGVIMGSPSYMAPEQWCDAGGIDHRADLYSVGCVLFAMLCGRPPFRGDSDLAIRDAHIRTPPPVPSSLRTELPPEVDALVLQLLAKNPGERFENALLLGHAVTTISGEQVSFAPSTSDTVKDDIQQTGTDDLPDTVPGIASRQRGHDRATKPVKAMGTGQSDADAGAQATRRSQVGQAARPLRRHGVTRWWRVAVASVLVLLVGSVTLSLFPGPRTPSTAEITQTPALPEQSSPSLEEPPPPRESGILVIPIAPAESRALHTRTNPEDHSGTQSTWGTGSELGMFGFLKIWVYRRFSSLSLSSFLSGSFFRELFALLKTMVTPIDFWQVETSPPGADVFQNGELIGNTETPLIIGVPSSSDYVQTLTLRLDRHKDKKIQLSNDPNTDAPLHPDTNNQSKATGQGNRKIRIEMEPDIGMVTIRIESMPPGNIWKNGKFLGRTPVDERFQGFPGKLTYKIKREGYRTKRISLPGVRDTTLKVELHRCPYKTTGLAGRAREGC